MKLISFPAAMFLIPTAWFFFAPTHAAKAATLSNSGASFQVAENEEEKEEEHEHHNYRHDQGHWKHDRDRYNDSDYNEWYWGQRGRWYQGNNGWQFRSAGLVCNNFGTDCVRGRNIPPNGEGMVNPKNPAFYFGCDSHGHHCTWKRRPGY